MALLSYREVLAYLYYIDISHVRAIARTSTELIRVVLLKFARFHDTLNK